MAHIETRVLRPTNPSGALSASGGAANRIAVFSGANTLTTSGNFTYDTSTESLTAGDSSSALSTHSFNGRSLVLTYAVSGGVAAMTVYNSSNTASSGALVDVVVQGGSAGDPRIEFSVVGVTDWTIGIDNSDSDSLKLSYGTVLGSNDFWTVTSAGKHVIGVVGGAQFHEVYGRGLNVAYGTAGVTAYVQAAHSSNSAGSGVCYYLQVAGASASDPFMTFDVATTTQWSIGLDNSNSDCFSISKSYSLGTNEYLNISTAGLFTFSNSGVIRYDQNAATRLQIRNDDTGAGAYTQLKLSTDSGDVNLTANSAAAGDSVSLTADSTFGGGMDIGILGANALRLNTAGSTRLTISGTGTSTFTGNVTVTSSTGPQMTIVDDGTIGTNADPYYQLNDTNGLVGAMGFLTSNSKNMSVANYTDTGSLYLSAGSAAGIEISSVRLVTIGASGETQIHRFNTATAATAGAAGDFLRLNVNGTNYKIQLYADS